MLAEVKRGTKDQDFSGRVKNIEDKLKGVAHDKKPKDLRRAIGQYIKCYFLKECDKALLKKST